jgi:hypothetical protein
MPSYLAITPVRDEELFLPDLIDSMRSQTILPSSSTPGSRLDILDGMGIANRAANR